jgi:hypothetical protein
MSPNDEFLSRLEPNAHLVHLYRDPAVLRNTVGRYLSDGFRSGESAVVIATRDHWNDFREELEARDHDPSRLQREGRLVVLDARSTLDGFMRRGMPDEGLFHGAIDPVLSTISASSPPNVRAFGEMVSLLWADRHFDAALRLEELWNRLAERSPFMLLCAYEGDTLTPEFHGLAAESVFLQHSRVLPSEDSDRLNHAVDAAMDEVLGPTEARTLRPLIAATQRRASTLSSAQATLLWFQSNLPHHAGAVLAVARRLSAVNGSD